MKSLNFPTVTPNLAAFFSYTVMLLTLDFFFFLDLLTVTVFIKQSFYLCSHKTGVAKPTVFGKFDKTKDALLP